MINIYRILFIPILLFSLPYYLKRMLKRGGYKKSFQQRLGIIRDLAPRESSTTKRIWIQAVSVGEILAIGPLLHTLKANKDAEVILSTTTSTAFQLAKEQYSGIVLKIILFPLDFLPFSHKAWQRIKPDLVILMEGELWPEHIEQAKQRKVPILLINARMSDRSFKRYSHFGLIGSWLLSSIDKILASTETDKERLISLGAKVEQTHCVGNIKFDVTLNPTLDKKGKEALLQELGFQSNKDDVGPPLILLGSSTWPGEEAMLLLTFEAAIKKNINCCLLLVPRHAERRNEIKALLNTQEQAWHFRSTNKQAPKPVKIYVADTTGELSKLTQIADIAFIGKSLSPNKGGQTPIEAAAVGLPIVYGPLMNNFKEISKSLEKHDAAIRTNDSHSSQETLLNLLEDQSQRQSLAKAAQVWHQGNQGASAKTLLVIREMIK